LLEASDKTIDDAVQYADPMALRGLLYQLTADADVAATKAIPPEWGPHVTEEPPEDVALLQRKAAEFLKSYRDAGAGEIEIGSEDRLPASLRLAVGADIPDEDMGLYVEDLALDPWARGLEWRQPPSPEQLENFSVTVIGAGLGGLNAAVQLKRAGIRYRIIEKNGGVGGTWYENRYPGARVDTLSRCYTHIFGTNFGCSSPYCSQEENERYFNWVADTFEVRDDIVFNTEVRSMTWDEGAAMWDITVDGPEGERVVRSNAVITAVGFLNRPNLPEIDGMLEFEGPSCHTAAWPDGMDLEGKRLAVIGTGCSGTQVVPELALEAEHVTVFQRTPQWLFGVPGYRSPFPPQVNWLDRNLPFYTNFTRFRASYGVRSFMTGSEVDPHFDDPNACNAENKKLREGCIAFLERTLDNAELVKTMTPAHPVFSARPVRVDADYSYLDAVQRDNVTLVTDGVKRINKTGVESLGDTQHDVDMIVYATGFRASDYLFPMTITGRDGKALEELWADDGARAYVNCMITGFPNMWLIYGPNTAGGLNTAAFHELVTVYALECVERLILDHKESIDVKEDAYWRYGHLVDERNARKVWSDPRANNYYSANSHGRSAVMCPFDPGEMWRFLRHPDFNDLEIR
jgi:4-hydroxyacetophenone monooxygenase